MAAHLKPGTPCFLVGMVNKPWLNGQVVTVVGPCAMPAGELGEWYELRAQWADFLPPGSIVVAPRLRLRPILPPGDDESRRVTATPVSAGAV